MAGGGGGVIAAPIAEHSRSFVLGKRNEVIFQ